MHCTISKSWLTLPSFLFPIPLPSFVPFGDTHRLPFARLDILDDWRPVAIPKTLATQLVLRERLAGLANTGAPTTRIVDISRFPSKVST